MKSSMQDQIKMLAQLDIDKYVRRGTEKVEENVKIKLTIPLLELLGYDRVRNMDFEHHIRNKRADIALMFKDKPKLIVETKDLTESLDRHVDQGLDYAFKKGVDWVVLTNGVEIRLYKSYMTGIPSEDRILFSTSLGDLPRNFPTLSHLASRESLRTAKKITKEAEKVRENVTAKVLIKDLAECREKLFKDLFGQFKRRYQADEKFKETIDSWAERVKMDVKDPLLIEKLCKEGAYTLINRVLFLRICEDKKYIKAKLCKDVLAKWRQMVEKPSSLLDMAFREIADKFEGLYKAPLFDDINFEDIRWNEETINFVLDELGEYDFSKITKDILGRAYEQHITREERKQLGQFYTPDFVIDYILDNTLDEVLREKAVQKIKILDPACGSGGFLMKAYDRLRTKYKQEDWADEVIHKEILKNNLYGIDINSFAAQLTVMNLLLKDLDHPTGDIKVVEGDTLEKLEQAFEFDIYQKESPLAGITRLDKKFSHGTLLRHSPFDIVVGNPPYVSFGLRGVGKISKGHYNYLKENYPNSAEYKISIYAVFMDRGVQLLGEHGRFGFVVPDSFLLGRFFSKLRRYILNSCRIIEIVLFMKDFWKYGVVGRPVIIILERESNKNLRLTNRLTARLCTNMEELRQGAFKSYAYRQSYFESASYNKFRLFFDSESKDLVERMESNPTELSAIVSFASGLIGKHGKREIISSKKLGQDWRRGLLSGNEIDRYSLSYQGGYISYDTDKLKSGFKDAEYFEPKILIRQTGDSIRATYDTDGFLCLNNLHVGNLIDSDYDLRFILGCLNSKLMNHYYHLISLELGRTMAQLDIETIEKLPIKRVSKEEQTGIVTLVDKMLTLNKQVNDPASVDKKEGIEKEIEKIDHEINENVYQLYGITEKERQLVEGAV